jgi:hypothetical protein
MSRRSSKDEVRRRVLAILKLRLAGAEWLDLVEFASAPEQAWGVSKSCLRRYVTLADRLCKEHFDAKAAHLLSRHCLQRRQLYNLALAAGDYRTALACLESEARLEQLPRPDPPAVLDAPLQSVGDVLRLLATTLNDYRGGRLDKETVAGVTNLAALALRAIEGSEIERRLADIEEKLGQRKQVGYYHEPESRP